MFSRNNMELTWFRWFFYFLGAALAISGSFLTWIHWDHGCFAFIREKIPGLYINFKHRPMPAIEDHGGLAIVLLSTATVVIAFCVHHFDKCPKEFTVVAATALAIIAGYHVLNVQTVSQAYIKRTQYMSGMYNMYPGEGLNRVFIGSLLLLFTAVVDYHFIRLQRSSEQDGRKYRTYDTKTDSH